MADGLMADADGFIHGGEIKGKVVLNVDVSSKIFNACSLSVFRVPGFMCLTTVIYG
jgi:hypothetical protein